MEKFILEKLNFPLKKDGKNIVKMHIGKKNKNDHYMQQ